MVAELSSILDTELIALAAAAHPLEACGLLLEDAQGMLRPQPCANVDPNPATRFEIDPQSLIDAYRAARAGGPQVAGYFHSHPLGPPEPSATDRAQTTGDGKLWAIIGEGRVGWWRDGACGFEALSYSPAPR